MTDDDAGHGDHREEFHEDPLGHADGFDAVEVNDRDDGQAAALAGKLLREFAYAHAAAADDGRAGESE